MIINTLFLISLARRANCNVDRLSGKHLIKNFHSTINNLQQIHALIVLHTTGTLETCLAHVNVIY